MARRRFSGGLSGPAGVVCETPEADLRQPPHFRDISRLDRGAEDEKKISVVGHRITRNRKQRF
jgi:hypothetical protein